MNGEWRELGFFEEECRERWHKLSNREKVFMALDLLTDALREAMKKDEDVDVPTFIPLGPSVPV